MESIKKRLENGEKFNIEGHYWSQKPEEFWLYVNEPHKEDKLYILRNTYSHVTHDRMNVDKITKTFMYVYTCDLLGKGHHERVRLTDITFINDKV